MIRTSLVLRIPSFLVLAGLLVALGCRGVGQGSAAIQVRLGKLSAAEVARVTVTVTGDGIGAPIVYDLDPAQGTWRGLIDELPAGPGRTFAASARGANGDELYRGEATGVTIVDGARAAVTILLQQTAPASVFANRVPEILSLSASRVLVGPGKTVELSATAIDADGDPLTFAWSVPAGSFSAPGAASTVFTAPATEGDLQLTLAVSDPKGATASASFTVTVTTSGGAGGADVQVTVNTWPVIGGLTSSPTPVAPGSATTLALSVLDADGDPLSFAWTQGACTGSFSAVTAQNPSWTAPAGTSCTLSVTVTDGRGGSATGALAVPIGTVVVNLPPTFTSLFQSARGVTPGGAILFRAAATDPEGQPIAFTWSASQGTFSAATESRGTSEVTWTAPQAGCVATVTVEARDSVGASARFDFPLSSCASCGNGVREAGEQCDGSDLGGTGCVQLGYFGGTLSCLGCNFDTYRCSLPPPESCANGVDDNGNGLVDCGEPSCNGHTTCLGSTVAPALLKNFDTPDAPNYSNTCPSAASPGVAAQSYLAVFSPWSASGTLLRSAGGAFDTEALATLSLPEDAANNPSRYAVAVGDTVYFSGGGADGDLELWKTDGTAAGTARVKDLYPGVEPSLTQYHFTSGRPSYLTLLNGVLYFSARDPSSGSELWRSDGTSDGTYLVKDLNPGVGDGAPTDLVVFNGALYFAATDAVLGRALWRSDGTLGGTTLVKSFAGGANYTAPSGLTVFGGALYFRACEASACGLWRSDGTAAGTVAVRTFNGYGPELLKVAGSTLYMIVWTSGSGASNAVVKELWKSDGTAAGTVRLTSIGSWPNTGYPVAREYDLVPFGGRIYFPSYASSGGGDWTLWRSDGTTAGTQQVTSQSLSWGSTNPPPRPFAHGGFLYFGARDATVNCVLYRTDGTAAGTTPIVDPRSGLAIRGPSLHGSGPGGLLYLTGYAASSQELWVTDGTPAGTRIPRVFRPSTSTSYPRPLLEAGGFLYFAAASDAEGYELRRTDGTSGGTVVVADLNPGSADSGLFADSFVALGSQVLFAGNDVASGLGYEPWSTNGTAAGTTRLKDVKPGSGSSVTGLYPYSRWIASGGLVYFAADDGVNGTELWRSDGTAEGTVLVKDLKAGSGSFSLGAFTELNGGVYFIAYDSSTYTVNLWRSDGTAAGTSVVSQLTGLGLQSTGQPMVAAAGRLLVPLGTGLYARDGTATFSTLQRLTPAGVGEAKALTPVGSRVFFTATDSTRGTELWVSDGTVAGTTPVADLNAGAASSYPGHLAAVGGTLVFTADDGVHGREPWVSDGTPAGTLLIKDLNPGVSGSVASSTGSVAVLGGSYFFPADDGIHGTELWRTDGTSAGTKLVWDLYPGPSGSSPTQLKAANGRLYFAANDGFVGTELWSVAP
ncbi:MAG: PKD domain-containing protein [Deltaproteobacteria bacterium]|nr:PKD domain-containing protein [Deltaproteobacteria bacterium]